jgi:DNA ligase-1
LSKVKDIIDAVGSTTKKNEKLEILRSVMAATEPALRRTLYYCYNPFKNYYIKKLLPLTITGSLSIDMDYGIFDLLEDLNDRKLTGGDAARALQLCMETYDEASVDIIKKIVLRDMRAGFSAETTNKVFPTLIPEFKVQLAAKFEPEKHDPEKLFLASAKLDGIRGVYRKDKGFFTRNGHKAHGFELQEEELQGACEEFGMDAIDGEMFTESIHFDDIQGAVMRDKNIDPEQKKLIKFNVFGAVVSWDAQVPFGTLDKMYDTIVNMAKSKDWEYIRLVEQEYIKAKDVHDHCERMLKLSFEGTMLRDPDKPSYEWKRSKALMKYKTFLEDDFTVTGHYEGKGKYKGMLGGLIVEGKVDGKTITSECGSGFDDRQREEYWDKRDSLIGEKVEIKYQNLTKKNSLRFPIFLKFKLDR